MSARTPGPWRTGDSIANLGCNRIWAGTALDIPVAMLISQGAAPADIDPEAQANAAFIVRACNAHDALVDALESATTALMHEQRRQATAYDRDAFNALIAACRGVLAGARAPKVPA